MPKTEQRVQLLHPEPGKKAPRISASRYDLVTTALWQSIPEDEAGVPFMELAGMVATLLPEGELEQIGSVGWYTISIKLDLEARGLIERVPGSRPQRLRRVAGMGPPRLQGDASVSEMQELS